MHVSIRTAEVKPHLSSQLYQRSVYLTSQFLGTPVTSPFSRKCWQSHVAKGSSPHAIVKQHKNICILHTIANRNRKATYMEKGLDHFARSTPRGREINDYKLLTSRFQFCLKFGLQKKELNTLMTFPLLSETI